MEVADKAKHCLLEAGAGGLNPLTPTNLIKSLRRFHGQGFLRPRIHGRISSSVLLAPVSKSLLPDLALYA
ncbi:MAG: hypothetical protein NZ820_07115 [Dehalococcoidia bacterium]|nr:hypothetical protein [Dehalococcoidia bacterium]